MTQEEKQLLLKDLCGRLLYGVIALKTYKEGSKTMESTSLIETNDIDMLLGTVEDMKEAHYTIKPYLRPMSSMTEEENEELKYVIELGLQALDGEEGHNTVSAAPAAFEIDFYNKHHFDYRGLIEKGLALEAPEGIYKT